MSLLSQARAIAVKASSMRSDIWGVNQNGAAQMLDPLDGSGQVPCYFSAVKSMQQLEDAHMKGIHETIVRVNKSNATFKPHLGMKVKLKSAIRDAAGAAADLTVIFKEFGHSFVNPEYVLGCEDQS